jgi:hypothetical protein
LDWCKKNGQKKGKTEGQRRKESLFAMVEGAILMQDCPQFQKTVPRRQIGWCCCSIWTQNLDVGTHIWAVCCLRYSLASWKIQTCFEIHLPYMEGVIEKNQCEEEFWFLILFVTDSIRYPSWADETRKARNGFQTW